MRRVIDVFRRRRRFWESVPLRGHLLALGAIFSIFSIFGFLSDIMLLGRTSWTAVLLTAVTSGVIAAFLALTVMKHAAFFIAAAALFVVVNWFAATSGSVLQPESSPLRPLSERMLRDSVGVITAVTTGYTLFLVFIGLEGRRYLRAHTEVALARDLHQRLVPSIERTIGQVEFFGASIPSNEVGGDLVDVVTLDGFWMAYVADVSGHGVASGALMGMFKSAMRTRLQSGCAFDSLLDGIDCVITDMRKPGMFVTCALVAMVGPRELQFTTAGHPPILHFRRATGVVDELSIACSHSSATG